VIARPHSLSNNRFTVAPEPVGSHSLFGDGPRRETKENIISLLFISAHIRLSPLISQPVHIQQGQSRDALESVPLQSNSFHLWFDSTTADCSQRLAEMKILPKFMRRKSAAPDPLNTLLARSSRCRDNEQSTTSTQHRCDDENPRNIKSSEAYAAATARQRQTMSFAPTPRRKPSAPSKAAQRVSQSTASIPTQVLFTPRPDNGLVPGARIEIFGGIHKNKTGVLVKRAVVRATVELDEPATSTAKKRNVSVGLHFLRLRRPAPTDGQTSKTDQPVALVAALPLNKKAASDRMVKQSNRTDSERFDLRTPLISPGGITELSQPSVHTGTAAADGVRRLVLLASPEGGEQKLSSLKPDEIEQLKTNDIEITTAAIFSIEKLTGSALAGSKQATREPINGESQNSPGQREDSVANESGRLDLLSPIPSESLDVDTDHDISVSPAGDTMLYTNRRSSLIHPLADGDSPRQSGSHSACWLAENLELDKDAETEMNDCSSDGNAIAHLGDNVLLSKTTGAGNFSTETYVSINPRNAVAHGQPFEYNQLSPLRLRYHESPSASRKTPAGELLEGYSDDAEASLTTMNDGDKLNSIDHLRSRSKCRDTALKRPSQLPSSPRNGSLLRSQAMASTGGESGAEDSDSTALIHKAKTTISLEDETPHNNTSSQPLPVLASGSRSDPQRQAQDIVDIVGGKHSGKMGVFVKRTAMRTAVLLEGATKPVYLVPENVRFRLDRANIDHQKQLRPPSIQDNWSPTAHVVVVGGKYKNKTGIYVKRTVKCVAVQLDETINTGDSSKPVYLKPCHVHLRSQQATRGVVLRPRTMNERVSSGPESCFDFRYRVPNPYVSYFL